MVKVKCWASCLGGCDKQSDEHAVSAGLFTDFVTVSGLPWLKGQTKDIPIKTAGSKILCVKHNNELSPLDTEAIKFFRALQEIDRLQNVRLQFKKTKYWPLIKYEVNGALIERWAAKVVVGLLAAFNEDDIWSLNEKHAICPPEEIVKSIYRYQRFQFPMGLYFAIAEGESHYTQDGVACTFLSDGKGVGGGVILFRNYRLLIWLNDDPNVSFLNSDGIKFGSGGESLGYRKERWSYTITNGNRQIQSQQLIFSGFEGEGILI